MTSEPGTSPGESPQLRRWDARFPSVGDTYALILSGVFLVVAGFAVRDVVAVPGSSPAVLVATIPLAICAYVLWNPTRHVAENADGSFSFSRSRTGGELVIAAGDLVSIEHYKIWLRVNNRMSPLVVTGRDSRFRFRPPFRDADSLIRALQHVNPHALVENWVRP